MPARNVAPFIRDAIGSILAQTINDFELIVIDDASTDDTAAVVEGIGDPRIRLLRNESCRGIGGSLNRGLELARGDFIARMDADDIALPTRFAKQVSFFEKHPEVGLCGTWVRMFAGDWHRDRKLETDPERMRCALLLFNVLSHPTAMWRRSLELRYDESYRNSEDYELWCRASQVTGIGNVGEVLLRYRVHPTQAGADRSVRLEEGARIRRAQLARLGAVLDEDELAVQDAIGMGCGVAGLRGCDSWFEKLLAANEKTRLYDPRVLRAFLKEQLWIAGAWRYATPRTLVRAFTGAIDDRRRATNSPPG